MKPLTLREFWDRGGQLEQGMLFQSRGRQHFWRESSSGEGVLVDPEDKLIFVEIVDEGIMGAWLYFLTGRGEKIYRSWERDMADWFEVVP